jgi:multiple sugar transport system permease protein
MSPAARGPGRGRSSDTRLAVMLVLPAIVLVTGLALVPVAATFWNALHLQDLRFPWLGTPFVGLDNFREAAGDPRFHGALARTIVFALVTVPVELALGLALALAMQHAVRGRAFVRVTVLLPWAIPTVVAALVWRFLFEAQTGIVNAPLQAIGLLGEGFDWFVHPLAAWVPIALADIWKTTPFVAILLLAGLQTIDRELYEAAQMDGAGPVRQFVSITLPLLLPALIVAGAFRALDALRLFDLSFVMTGGGPGTATEPLSLYAFVALMQRLRFGYGSALSISVFVLTFAFALICVRALSRTTLESDRT